MDKIIEIQIITTFTKLHSNEREIREELLSRIEEYLSSQLLPLHRISLQIKENK